MYETYITKADIDRRQRLKWKLENCEKKEVVPVKNPDLRRDGECIAIEDWHDPRKKDNFYVRRYQVIDEETASHNLSEICEYDRKFPDCQGCSREQFFKCLDRAGKGKVDSFVARIKNIFLRAGEEKVSERETEETEHAQGLPYKDSDHDYCVAGDLLDDVPF